ncbi:ribosomal protein S6 kinase delta-1 [Bacillus rossius redtenbacheri]|uniref:ribosomal protein S6 kinase delta-1 n=1 Tax=Bacillus rossius redtenbacheri TaxID=93214 RepID=UPI002FDCAE6C
MSRITDDNWVRRFAVCDPRRHKKGFTVYKVTSVVFPKHSPDAASRVVVWKRYSDFKNLHRELKIKHKKLHLKDTFPAFVKAKFFGRFEDEVIEERRLCALNLLEFIGKNSVLFTSNVVVKFFESGYTMEEQQAPPEVQVVVTDESCWGDSATGVDQGNPAPHAPAPMLGGTWQFPQAPDNISLSSHSSDDRTTFTDTDSVVSGVSSPLQATDLQFFDPLAKNVSEAGVSPVSESSYKHSGVSNSILLSTELSSTTASKPDCVSVQTQDFRMAAGQGDGGAGYSQVVEGLLSSDVFLPSGDAPGPGRQDVNYVFEAAYHVGRAQQYEASEDYEAAFAFYKAGVACLLSGVQDDPDPKRKQVVKVKTTRYLLQAERIYNQHLACKTSANFGHTAATRQLCPASRLARPAGELILYKVLGIVSKVMLVLHSVDDCCYVMKVVHKSPCPVGPDKRTIIPQNVPFMVALYKYYETESGIFLVLKHASGGKLWDHVGSYFQSLPQTPTRVATREGEQTVTIKPGTEAPTNKAVVEPHDGKDQDDSYLELIEDYKSCKNGIANPEDSGDAPNDVVSEVTEGLKILMPISGSKESVHQLACLPDVGSVMSTPRNMVPDLVPQQRWDEGGDVATTDLVAKAQRLLESVSRTLHASETAASFAFKEPSVESPGQQEVRSLPKSNLCGISHSPVDISPKIGRRRERLRFSGRKLGRRFSVERRYSSDDLFEGRGRACSGSLDCLEAKVGQLGPRLPEATVRVWAAEMLVAIETLHRWGIICRDLNPDNVLLGDGGHVFLTYQCQWASVDCVLSREAVESLYAAPEVRSIFPLTPAVDWWSYGALLFELLTGKSLYYCHPGGIHNHTILNVPDWVSDEARHLLTELLRFDPGERLGSGMNGTQELKSHPFFSNVNWDSILDVGTACS